MKRFLVSLAVAVCLVGASTATAEASIAAPQLPPTCSGQTRAPQCAAYTGGLLRAVLSNRGVQRPLVSNTQLGLIAQDICLYNDVRPALESVLWFPDAQVSNFFMAAHNVC